MGGVETQTHPVLEHSGAEGLSGQQTDHIMSGKPNHLCLYHVYLIPIIEFLVPYMTSKMTQSHTFR